MAMSRSKSTSQIQLTSLPSWARSLRQATKIKGSVVSVRKFKTWLQPAGFLMRIIRREVPWISNCSIRPNPQENRPREAAVFSGAKPSALPTAMAVAAL